MRDFMRGFWQGMAWPLCLIRTVWWSLKAMATVSGHSFIEVHRDRKSQTLRCEVCGMESTARYATDSKESHS